MSYVVLARKWRPQQFSDVLGQEHVTRTLTNAINASRIAHAFLFSGPRGVGKTSAARILAKALCCEKTPGPTATPCGVCKQCVEITEGRSTDVFEIDAASHTGVDNVREIIDNVRYLPSSARFKIYVIDEVHMLSTGAFNALLKTLEEPPLHVKFILATTDVHKVPVTILSRCQRYDFRRIPLTEIAERLSGILEREGIDHDASALSLVAREAEGSMRDAQSLLEQVLAFADGRKLDGALVRESLGVVDGALIARAFEALLARNPGALIQLASDVHERGLDLKRFCDALVEESRDLLVAKLVPEPGVVLDRPKDEVAQLIERAKEWETVSLERLFDQLCVIVEDVGKSPHPRFALEIGLASIAEQPARVPVQDLLERLTRMETQLLGMASSPTSPVRRTQDWRTGRNAPAPYARTAKPVEAEDAEETEAETQRVPEPEPAPEPVAAVDELDASDELDESDESTIEDELEAPSAPPPPTAQPPAAPPPVATQVASSGGGFAGFVELLKKKRPSLAATLSQVRPLAFAAGDAELGCESSFDEQKLKDHDTRMYLEALLAEYFGRPTVLRVSRTKTSPSAPAPASVPETLNEVEEKTREARRTEKGSAALARPAVKTLGEELGATVSKVRVLDEG